MATSPLEGEDKEFSEKKVDEITKPRPILPSLDKNSESELPYTP